MLVQSCNAQKSGEQTIYSNCEPRPASSRLNIRATAEDFGAITPCQGQLLIYINKNTTVRSLNVDMEYLNPDNKILSKEMIRVNLEPTQTGVFEKKFNLLSVEDVKCWDIQIAMEKMTCFTQYGSETKCPKIRIHTPDSFHSLLIADKSLKVCSNE